MGCKPHPLIYRLRPHPRLGLSLTVAFVAEFVAAIVIAEFIEVFALTSVVKLLIG